MTAKPIWTIAKVLDWTKQYFAEKGLENPRLDAEILLCSVLKCQRITLYVHFDQPLEEHELAQYRGYVARRAAAEPLAYILGSRAFMKYDFKVTPDVLVPRPETELLVECAAKLAGFIERPQILDIGTGSGAIIVSLLDMLPEAHGTAVDVSPGALAVAKENAANIGVAERLQFVRSDLYSALPRDAVFDVIISNPPYIPSADIAGLAADVKREPRLALDGGADGLNFYRRIIAGSTAHLKDGGFMAFEIGINQGSAVAELCRSHGFGVVAVRRDYAGIERMVFAAKEGTTYADALLELAK